MVWTKVSFDVAQTIDMNGRFPLAIDIAALPGSESKPIRPAVPRSRDADAMRLQI